MKLFGLTGGIGMGKSTAGDCLRELGVPVVDTDDIARDIVEPGEPALAEVTEEFGPGILTPAGLLNREKLAALVFDDPPARQRLEAMLHPRIRAVWQARADEWRTAGHPAGVVIIPLLFETGAETNFTATLCLACSCPTQERRLAGRGWTPAQSARRIAAQMPVGEKMRRADFVIWNEAGREVMADQLRRVLMGGTD